MTKKINLKGIVTIISIAICIIGQFSFAKKSSLTVSANGSSSEIVMEVNTNRVLHQNNAFEKKYMASTTKILTAITIIENCNLDDVVTVTEETVGVEGSSIYLEAGEKLSVRHLLYGLMLRSGNDCAETLAVHCSNSIENFATLMNNTAEKIGATNSNFVNPHGLHDDSHYTTAYDLALISCYAIKNPEFKEIVSTKIIKIPFTTREYDRVLINKNKMLKEFEGSTGIKTGYTKKAGRCLVSSCTRDGLELVSIVLNCPPMFERSKVLLANSFNNYKNYKLVESDHIIDFISTNNPEVTCPVGINEDIILPLTEQEYNNINIEYDLPTIINLPIKKDSEIGCVKIYAEKELIFQKKIYTIIDVN